jgi:hypothetical protein
MLVFFKFGRMTNEVEYIRATAEACQAEIDAVLDINPALEYEIVEQGAV